jgi:uncharacterized membrane protein YhaH (DUF805 family)
MSGTLVGPLISAGSEGGHMTTGSGAVSITAQLIPWFVLAAIAIPPYLRILRKVGRSGWWSLLLFLPLLGFLVLPWIVAYMRWNRDGQATAEIFS